MVLNTVLKVCVSLSHKVMNQLPFLPAHTFLQTGMSLKFFNLEHQTVVETFLRVLRDVSVFKGVVGVSGFILTSPQQQSDERTRRSSEVLTATERLWLHRRWNLKYDRHVRKERCRLDVYSFYQQNTYKHWKAIVYAKMKILSNFSPMPSQMFYHKTGKNKLNLMIPT